MREEASLRHPTAWRIVGELLMKEGRVCEYTYKRILWCLFVGDLDKTLPLAKFTLFP